MSDEKFTIIENLFKEFSKNLHSRIQTECSWKLNRSLINNETGDNFLIFTMKKTSNPSIIKVLLECDFDIDHKDNQGLNAIDHAWISFTSIDNKDGHKENVISVMLNLLNSNSKYPSNRVGFNCENAPDLMKNFINNSEELQKLVRLSKTEELKLSISAQPHLRYFYDSNNQSLMMYALRRKKYDILREISKILSIGQHESLHEVYFTYSSLSTNNFELGNPNLPKPHILLIQSKSHIYGKNQSHQNWESIHNVYLELDENPTCSKILHVIAWNMRIQIIFVFGDDVGIDNDYKCSEDDKIYIFSAQDLLDDDKKWNIIDQIIQKFSSIALTMLHLEYCDQQVNLDKLDSSSSENQFEATVQRIFNDTNVYSFDYFKNTNFAELLYCWKLLINETECITYNHLIEPMKSKILRTKIYFEGVETNLYDLVEEDKEVLGLLSSDQIRDILLRNNQIRICEDRKIVLEQYIIDRKFKISSDELIKKYESKMSILADNVGTGKSVAFKIIATKSKESYKTHWVEYIDLCEKEDIIKKIINKNVEVCKENIIDIMLSIIGIELKLEIVIFKILFIKSAVILLFDEIDKTESCVADFAIKIIDIIQKNSSNYVWIASCPEFMEKFKKWMNLEKVINLIPFEKHEQSTLIHQYLTHNKQLEVPNQLLSFLNALENQNKQNYVLNNPLLITRIIDQFMDNASNFTKDSINYYKVFEDVYKKHFGIQNIELETAPIGAFTLSKYHQVHALESLFGSQNHEPQLNLNDFGIVLNWKREKQYWTLQRSQKSNFLFNASCLDPNKQKSSNFIHLSFAEFFVVQYITSFMFSNDYSIRKEEFVNIFNLLKLIVTSSDNYEMIGRFLLSYITYKCPDELHEGIKGAIAENTSFISQNIEVVGTRNSRVWFEILRNESETLRNMLCQLYTKGYFTNKKDDFWKELSSNTAEIMKSILTSIEQQEKNDLLTSDSSDLNAQKMITSEINETDANIQINEKVTSSVPSILTEFKAQKIDERFIIKMTKDITNISNKKKYSGKVLHLSTDWSFDEVMEIIAGLNPQEYPNLFVFVIDIANTGLKASKLSPEKLKVVSKADEIKDCLHKFSHDRPIILQLTSVNEKLVKIYFKYQYPAEFKEVNNLQSNPKKIDDFESFLKAFINGNFKDAKESIAESIFKMKDSSIILRFWKIFELSEEFWRDMILECAEEGKLSDFLAILDASYESKGRILSNNAQRWLFTLFVEQIPLNQPETTQKNSDIDSEHDTEVKTDVDVARSELSVLSTSIKHSNKEIIDYLINYCSHLIQQLPFHHQLEISTTAFYTNQLDILCDLIQLSDFPFPKDFKPQGIENERLNRIVDERTKLYESIKDEDEKNISEFIDKNLNLRIAYSTNNTSALNQAVDLQSYKTFYFLKSEGFYATEFENIEEVLSKEELREAYKIRTKIQRKMQKERNVEKELSSNSIDFLCNRSFIHNKRRAKEREEEYRKVIRKWFEDINKIKYGEKILDVAASFEELQIIFDFESTTDEYSSLERAGSVGVMYPYQKCIFIGAKLDDDGIKGKRFQLIRGVLAHELCQYVMKLIYENNENPYYKHCKDTIENFEAVEVAIDKSPGRYSENPDDECDEIISSVFRRYAAQDLPPLFITRTMMNFDNDKEKTDQLEDKYNDLLNYWEEQVWPEMQKFNLKIREKVREINRIFQLLRNIKEFKLELLEIKIDINSLLDNKFVIIRTNNPKLLLIDIYNKLYDKFGVLLDTKNIFVDPKVLKNSENYKDFQKLMEENSELNLIVDYTGDSCEEFKVLMFSSESRILFIVKNTNKAEEVKQIFYKKEASEIEINYNCNDLTRDSLYQLLRTRVNFQNNSKVSLLELFEARKELEEEIEESSSMNSSQFEDLPSSSPVINQSNDANKEDLIDIIDDELLDILLNQQLISINNTTETPKNFSFLYLQRGFENSIDPKRMDSTKKYNLSNLSENNLVLEAINNKYVLISDIAGNGKSWAMIQISKTLMEKYPTCWVTYVDLKQFIKAFKTQNSEKLDFPDFVINEILIFKYKFERKIFKKMYEFGKVVILFDGFDEIAPDCAEFVCQLAKSFEQNGGNQMWIATRDYFRVDLQKELQIEKSFKLKNFTKENGARFIANSWMLNEPETKELKLEEEFEKLIKKSEKYKNFLEMASNLVEKVCMSKNSIGMPHIYKIIAEISKDDKKATINFTQTDLYKSLVQEFFWIWATQKGEIRHQASEKSLEFELSFCKFHQYLAILTLFPEYVEIFYAFYDKSEWTDGDVIACGIVKIEDGKYLFTHETIREYFVADFIIKGIRSESPCREVFDMFAKILTMKKFELVQIFLNESLNSSDLNKVLLKMQTVEVVKIFKDMDSFANIFSNMQAQFVDLIIKILISKSNELSNILKNHACELLSNSTTFVKFQNFLFNHCNDEYLKALVKKGQVFLQMIGSCLEIEHFEEFVTNLEKKLETSIINEGLKAKNLNAENILNFLCEPSNLDISKFRKFFEILKRYLSITEIYKLMYNCNKNEATFAQIVLERTRDPLESWKEIQEIVGVELFKKLVSKEDINSSNILFYIRNISFDEFKKFWDKIFELFDLNTLESMMMKINNDGECFMHNLLSFDCEFLTEILVKRFGTEKFGKLLKLKSEYKDERQQKYVLESIANSVEVSNVDIYVAIWQSLKQACDTDQEFLKILNVSCLVEKAFYFENKSNDERVEFVINEFNKFTACDELKNLLKNKFTKIIDFSQSVLLKDGYFEAYKKLFKLYSKIFNFCEIIKILEKGLKDLIRWGKLKLIEYTWSEIKKFKDQNESALKHVLRRQNWKENLVSLSIKNCKEVLKWTRDIFKDFGLNYENEISERFDKDFQRCIELGNHENVEKLLTKYEKIFEKENLLENFKFFLLRSNSSEKNCLHQAVMTKNVESVKVLWTKILKISNDFGFIAEIFMEVDIEKKTILHALVAQSSYDIFEFLFNQLKTITSAEEIKEILSYANKSTGSLLYSAAKNVKLVNFHEKLWIIFKKYFKPQEIIKLISNEENNILISAVTYNILKIIELIWYNYKSLMNQNQLVQYLRENLRKIFEASQKNENKVELQCWMQNILTQHPVILLDFQSMNIKKIWGGQRDLLLYVLNLKFDEKLIKENLTSMNKYDNLFQNLTYSVNHFDRIGADKYLKNLKNYLTIEEIHTLMKNCNKNDENIFHLFVKTKNARKTVQWLLAVYNLFSSEDQKNLFYDLFEQINLDQHNFLELSVFNSSLNFHSNIWDFSKEILTEDGIVQNFIKKTDKNGKNFIELLVEHNKNPEVVIHIYQIFKLKLDQYYHEEVEKFRALIEANENVNWFLKLI